jgi:ATP-dependent helicase/nuclease subunit A
MSGYFADDHAIDAATFTRRACDPQRSVVVQACAGSGKTWLLVSRIIRQLLAGAAPGEILAITFTRRAAQEMRARLMRELQQLAQADDAGIVDFLQVRGLTLDAARAAVDPARHLYERVAAARLPITIETFHGWFWQLLARAPLGSGMPFAPALLEATDRLRADAWMHFTAALTRSDHAAERAAWEELIDAVGDFAARTLLLQWLAKRAEWWALAGGDNEAAFERALAPLRRSADPDAARRVREPQFVAAIGGLVEGWCSGSTLSASVQGFCETAQRWLAREDSEDSDSERDFSVICQTLLTKNGTVRAALTPEKIGPKVDPALRSVYSDLHASAAGHLLQLIDARSTNKALRINEAALRCGRLLIDSYQRLKTQQQALDFTDLEWHAYRLLADADHAAYLQCRLDARYRHILIDEFQDTNPLQWQVLLAWLGGYGAAENGEPASDGRPTVFIVGDPKQSIYRFRRAEPRLFAAARELLRRDFAAVHLRTNVTRRNAQAVVDVLNAALPGNPLYQPQHTCAAPPGAFVLLPLAVAAEPTDPRSTLRDVLTEARPERDNDTHYREGCAIANELAYWVRQLRVDATDEQGRVTARAARWSDVLILVRQRTHLADYERALRDAGVPFVSDRRGGLLMTLEADDLTALLQFLSTPFADLQLAHALRSPIFNAGDADLMLLAQTPGATWWQRLQAVDESASAALATARTMLARWLALAGVLPVHDLLDRIYFEADLRRRYAAVAPAALHGQVQANLDAFIELALALDAGRYPSLPRFIEEMASLKRHAAEEAPDEGPADGGDAVRVMTIHGAKGLEAEIVVVADAHQRAAQDRESVLVVWPPQQASPEHLSVVTGGARDSARAAWLADDDAQRAQEDWNLLYVAATRARQVLIVAGSAPGRGSPDDSWHVRLQAAQHLSRPPAALQPTAPTGGPRSVRDFLPAPLPTGSRTVATEDTEAMRLGRAWHAVLELGDASLDEVARVHRLAKGQRDRVAAAASRVRRMLPQFFDGGVQAELDLVDADGELLRVDRLVEHGDALWIVDFKWRVTAAERAAYETQVRRYATVLGEIRRDKPIRRALVLADGEVIEVGP